MNTKINTEKIYRFKVKLDCEATQRTFYTILIVSPYLSWCRVVFNHVLYPTCLAVISAPPSCTHTGAILRITLSTIVTGTLAHTSQTKETWRTSWNTQDKWQHWDSFIGLVVASDATDRDSQRETSRSRLMQYYEFFCIR